MTRAKWLMLAGYNTFFWAAFWLFCYWTFPYDRLASFLSDKVAESGAGYTLDIGDLSPHWVTGVTLNDVTVRKVQAPGAAPVPPPPPTPEQGKAPSDGALKIEEAHARIGLLSLLFGGKSLTFDAALEQGEIEGSYEEDGEQKHLDATLSKIDIGKLGLLESVISLPAKGTFEGDFDLTLGKDPTKSNGTVKITFRNMVVGDGVAKLKVGSMGGLTIDPVNLGDVVMNLDVKDGVGQVKELRTTGSDVKLEGSGDVRFADPLSRSRLDILMRIQFTDAYKNKSGRTKAMFSLLDSNNGPQLRAAKTPDGALAYRLTGALASVRAIPAGRAKAKGAAIPGPAAPAVPPAPGDDDE
jgi:type II secretion system protein N